LLPPEGLRRRGAQAASSIAPAGGGVNHERGASDRGQEESTSPCGDAASARRAGAAARLLVDGVLPADLPGRGLVTGNLRPLRLCRMSGT
jgi:hypothetical protein